MLGQRVANITKAMRAATQAMSDDAVKKQLHRLRKALSASAPTLAADLLPEKPAKGDSRWRSLAAAALTFRMACPKG